ncbi:cell division protein FtsW [Bacillus sp. FJAT-27225]|uniref:FtsW/RodA/SpoVE family cell cycle protein n=1 Tax=Bacillus sp. FJAT-27225 TaxID=1743144 RepID=UPI00080C347A|nr:FtsW/RodA/SpoVE family cell cycle protein [Bacillus sp. FJAT-27225]OCA85580.1 cell division protein FtsW [Bacillus sp. FJAT-27225]
MKNKLKSYDYTLILAIIVLSIFGLVMVYSASMAAALNRYGYEHDFFYQKQKMALLGSAVIFFVFAYVFPYRLLKKTAWLILIVLASFGALGAVLVMGSVKGNAQSWFDLGLFSIQPAEFAKVSVIIYLSAVYAKKQSYINNFNKGVVPPLAYLIIICGLIIFQPDFGTAAIIMAIAIFIIFSSGMNLKNIMKLVVIGAAVITIVALGAHDWIFSEERLSRLSVLEDPFRDVRDEGFHLSNSLIAIGSGGITGLGLGQGIQKLGYLPESHTDFIISVIAEELGLLGVTFVVLCLCFIVLKGYRIAMKCRDPFGSLLAIGISSMIGIQSIINLAGVSGIIPLTGVPLPFVSYGGSSIMQLAMSAGILVNVSMYTKLETNSKKGTAKPVPEKSPVQSKFYRTKTGRSL